MIETGKNWNYSDVLESLHFFLELTKIFYQILKAYCRSPHRNLSMSRIDNYKEKKFKKACKRPPKKMR